MKLVTIVLTWLIVANAYATPVLTDLFPGGTDQFHIRPVRDFDRMRGPGFFDEVTVDGWVSLYGLLHGADYIQAKSVGDTTAQISWDFSGTPYFVRYVYIQTFGYGLNLYEVSPKFRNGSSGGFVPVTLDGNAPVISVAFFGRVGVPESGSTLALLGLALIPLLFVHLKQRGVEQPGSSSGS